MKDLQREILSQVAAGTITAEEGAARLEALESESISATPTPPAGPVPSGPAVRQVRLQARFGNTEVIGDPSVSFAVADGPHRVRQDGDTMVIEQSLLKDDASFEFSRPLGRVNMRGLDFGRKLTVRMNPGLALSALVQAGNLRISGLRGPVSGDIQAGNCDIAGFRAPINLNVTAGNVTAAGRLDSGGSAIRCQMGEVRVVLDKTSSVRIKAHTTMGEVSFAGVEAAGKSELTVGSGIGTLDCDCMMGSVRIAVE